MSQSQYADIHKALVNYGENLFNMFPDENYGGHSNEQYPLEQASMYQSFEVRNHNRYIASILEDENYGLAGQSDSSRCDIAMKQVAKDESEHSGNASGSLGSAGSARSAGNAVTAGSALIAGSAKATPQTAQASSSNSRQAVVDDGESEESKELSKTVSPENKGISESRIAQLPTSKYKSGLFSTCKKKEM
ncbi:hypothetical protein L1987_52893 [Smallanthus sonchifolius]|uniref:Uncharacterized protein n=1 Tax=Smallanthus sonchifolius TaxID=185202 RepID=A0ACB9EV09_9ASTR|nr:hypothetical protein L1987_52893 [Smallanthus sonchifolius]